MIYLKLIIGFILIVVGDFVLWRKWREEYPDEDIFGFSIAAGTVAVLAGLGVQIAETGRWEWGMAGWGMLWGIYAITIWWSRKKRTDVWENMDVLTGVVSWIWVLTGWMSGWRQSVAAVVGLIIVAFTRNNYRHWRWYKSGRMGLVSLMFLGWFGLTQITVAFLEPGGIYWGGLEPRQWTSAWLLAFVIVTIYLRSGRKVKEDLGYFKPGKNGQK